MVNVLSAPVRGIKKIDRRSLLYMYRHNTFGHYCADENAVNWIFRFRKFYRGSLTGARVCLCFLWSRQIRLIKIVNIYCYYYFEPLRGKCVRIHKRTNKTRMKISITFRFRYLRIDHLRRQRPTHKGTNRHNKKWNSVTPNSQFILRSIV